MTSSPNWMETRSRVILAVTFFAIAASYFLWAAPPVTGDVSWGQALIAETPELIWGSSHLAQVINFETLSLLRWLGIDAAATDALHLNSRLMGVLFLAAVLIQSARIASLSRRLAILLVSGLLAPVTVFFHGYEEIGFYSLPVFLLALGFAFSGAVDGLSHQVLKKRRLAVFIAGWGAALHGLGLFFFPSFVRLRIRRGPSVLKRLCLGENITTLALFFGPTGICTILYFFLFPESRIFAGDTNGGANGGLLLPLSGSIYGYSLWSLYHLTHVGWTIAVGAPAFGYLLVYALMVRSWQPLRSSLLWASASGLIFVVMFYPNKGRAFDLDLLIAAVSALEVASIVIFFETVKMKSIWGFTNVVAFVATQALASIVLWRSLLAAPPGY